MKKEEYAIAVGKFVDLAELRTGGGRVAAQVLLSAYNGFDFQLDVSDLGSLDRENFETAMIIIRGRYETGIEPHSLIPNGSQVFQRLWDKWIRLHVKERGKRECPKCSGIGRIFVSDDDEEGGECGYCAGSGRVCECKAP